MYSDLAQTVALAAYGDAWLRMGGEAPELFPDLSAFHFVRRVAFLQPEPPELFPDHWAVRFLRRLGLMWYGPPFFYGQNRDPATAPWYQDLHHRGASALQVATWGRQEELPDHIRVAAADYGPYGVQVVYEGSWELWVRERFDDPVIYRGHSMDAPLPVPSFDEADRELREALDAVIRFAGQPGQTSWMAYFTKARRLRDAAYPGCPDLLPEGSYSAEARRLLACASKAGEAFGGMGSWNDLGFEDPALQEEYERVSHRLYDAAVNAIAAAANAGDR